METEALYDILGKEIISQNASGKTKINIIHLSNGIYNVRIVSDEEVVGYGKVMKQ